MEDNKEVFFHGGLPYSGGQMVIGAILVDRGELVDTVSGMVPYKGTSERAQWEALLQGMDLASRNNVRRLILKGDSKSVINYMNGQFPERDFDSMDYLQMARKKQIDFDQCFFQWVPFDKNTRAVALTMREEED